jgi:hypothetical protein
MGEQHLELDGGLEVAFDADVFGEQDLALLGLPHEVYFGAVEIPERDWPTGGLGDWTILRAWSTAIWDLEETDAFQVRAPLGDAGPLSADAEVAFLVADYTFGFINGVFSEEPAVLSEDGTAIVTPEEGGLDRSTLWLAVARDVSP